MPSDEDLINERRTLDERKFLINATDPDLAPRLAPSMNAVRDLLADGQWRPHAAVLAAGLRNSDLAVRTVENMLIRAWRAGLLERRGEYTRTRKYDTRQWRLIEWPTQLTSLLAG